MSEYLKFAHVHTHSHTRFEFRESTSDIGHLVNGRLWLWPRTNWSSLPPFLSTLLLFKYDIDWYQLSTSVIQMGLIKKYTTLFDEILWKRLGQILSNYDENLTCMSSVDASSFQYQDSESSFWNDIENNDLVFHHKAKNFHMGKFLYRRIDILDAIPFFKLIFWEFHNK